MNLETVNNPASPGLHFKTQSLCPVCLRVIDADIVSESGSLYMLKSCPEHGSFRTVVWSGSTHIDSWIMGFDQPCADRGGKRLPL